MPSWMWTEMTNQRTQAVVVRAQVMRGTRELPSAFQRYISHATNDQFVRQMRHAMRNAIHSYLQQRKEVMEQVKQDASKKESFYARLDRFLQDQRTILIESKAQNVLQDCSKLAAVLLYDECRLSENRHHNQALGLAWSVAMAELLQVSSLSSLSLSSFSSSSNWSNTAAGALLVHAQVEQHVTGTAGRGTCSRRRYHHDW